MKAVVWLGPRQMALRDVPEPEPAEGEVLIRVDTVGICGSELSGFLGQSSIRVPPLIMGHEFTGRIIKKDQEVEGFRIDDPVVVNPLITCGSCAFCGQGLENLCKERQLVGVHRPGAFAEFVAVPATSCTRLPSGLDKLTASLAEPFACSIRATLLGGVREGSRVLILGAGAIGLLCITAVQEAGGTVSLVTEVNPERLATAKKWGAQDVCDARSQDPVEAARQITDGLGVDVAIDAVGSTATRIAAVRSVRAGGVVVFIGLHEEQSLQETNYVIRNEIHLTGTFAYTPRDFAKAVALLAAKKVQISDEWLEERELEACAASFTQLVDGSPAVAKISLHP